MTQIVQVAASVHAGFLLGVFLDPEVGGDVFRRNVGRLLTELHGVMLEKLELFKICVDFELCYVDALSLWVLLIIQSASMYS
jgi:hypothetical protein